MPVNVNILEIERIQNLIMNFGWKVVKQEMSDKRIVLTIQKDRVEPEIEVDVGAS